MTNISNDQEAVKSYITIIIIIILGTKNNNSTVIHYRTHQYVQSVADNRKRGILFQHIEKKNCYRQLHQIKPVNLLETSGGLALRSKDAEAPPLRTEWGERLRKIFPTHGWLVSMTNLVVDLSMLDVVTIQRGKGLRTMTITTILLHILAWRLNRYMHRQKQLKHRKVK